MTKYEFSDKLRRALQGRLNASAVESNVKYYEEYIDSQIRQGKSEVEVLDSLGDPRLIARTIIDTSSPDKASVYPGPDPGDDHSFQGADGGDGQGNWKRIKLSPIVIFIVVILILVLIGTIAIKLAPFIILICFISWMIRKFRK